MAYLEACIKKKKQKNKSVIRQSSLSKINRSAVDLSLSEINSQKLIQASSPCLAAVSFSFFFIFGFCLSNFVNFHRNHFRCLYSPLHRPHLTFAWSYNIHMLSDFTIWFLNKPGRTIIFPSSFGWHINFFAVTFVVKTYGNTAPRVFHHFIRTKHPHNGREQIIRRVLETTNGTKTNSRGIPIEICMYQVLPPFPHSLMKKNKKMLRFMQLQSRVTDFI